MRQIDQPEVCKVCSKTLFEKCAGRIQKKLHRETLLSHKDEVECLRDEYEESARSLQLNELQQVVEFWDVPKSTWNNLYKNHMGKPGKVGRDEYDAIKLRPPSNVCPFCSVQTVKTVDHFLPKAKYPQYSILPANLIGSCRDCNTEKDEYSPDFGSQLFHPYFESVNGRWLTASVGESTPPSIDFQVDDQIGLDETTFSRAEKQFSLLKLGAIYSSVAANEMSSIELFLEDLLMHAGVDEVKEHLKRTAESAKQAVHPIEWKVALYEALFQNDWYCNGGFRFG